jgi:hypothetical protein
MCSSGLLWPSALTDLLTGRANQTANASFWPPRLHDKAGFKFLDRPRRREAAGRGHNNTDLDQIAGFAERDNLLMETAQLPDNLPITPTNSFTIFVVLWLFIFGAMAFIKLKERRERKQRGK